MMSKELIQHYTNEFDKHAPYLILMNKFKDKDYDENLYIKDYRGRRLLVMDGGDKPIFWPPYIQMALHGHIYYKDNSFHVQN